uniref:Vacuolar protein sorting-associated protein 27 n=1 Tax=Blastobotrys adeninivorans TaxID=409370 RepID=A0A060TFB9_BLAAD
MSWFSSSAQVTFDQMVERATSESLPTGEQDLALNLEICDMIRSKTVTAQNAMRTLKRRLLHANPNVQIATLHLVDTCIKNGGTLFLMEIASREFMTALTHVLKPVSGQVNGDVRELTLQYLQNWAVAFEGQVHLSHVSKVYEQLKQEGFEFPPYTKISSAFIDSSAPPEWVDSDTCMKCGTAFTFVNRKHHCRNCGGVFDQKHCQNYISLPHYGINDPVRVCDDCFDKLKKPSSSSKQNSGPVSSHVPSRPTGASSYKPSSGPVYDDEDDPDLKRALELSLQDSQSAAPPQPAAAVQPNPTSNDDEEDEDMKAAIAASLRDMESPKTQQPQQPTGLYDQAANGYQQYSQQSQQQPQQQPQEPLNHTNTGSNMPPVEPDDFSPMEQEILFRYVQLVEDLQRAPPGAILKETKLQQLNDNVAALRPKLARTLGRTIDKYDRLVDMHGKLTTVVRFYDQMLEQRLSETYSRHYVGGSDGQYAQPPSQAPQSQLQPQFSGGSAPPYDFTPSAPPLSTHSTGQPIAPTGTGNSASDSYYPSLSNQPQNYQYQTPQQPLAPQQQQQPQQPQQQQQQQSHAPSKPAEEPVLIEL